MIKLPTAIFTALFAAHPAANFVQQSAFTNPQGRTVVRFQQTYRGARVFAGQAIGHVEANGVTRVMTQSVKDGIALEGEPSIGASQAIDLALKNLGTSALRRPPTAELIVFPTEFTSGIETTRTASGKIVIDRELSLLNSVPTAPYVWAWEVHTAENGRSLAFVVDGNTGAILRKWDRIQREAAVQGTGESFHHGVIPLSTTQAADGTYALKSLNHGTLPQPFMRDYADTQQIGLAIYYGVFDPDHQGSWLRPYAGHATNHWGNGQPFPAPIDPDSLQPLLQSDAARKVFWSDGAVDPVGETTAVDAMFGLSATWDFYKQIFNRDGIDGIGTSTMAIVHDMGNYFTAYPILDNAFWNDDIFGMEFGDGSYPANPGGLTDLLQIDVTGHELTHGVTAATAQLIYRGLSGGLNEGNSDIFGKMVQAWVEGGRGATVPDFPAGDLDKWELARGARPDGSGLRTMYKPSLDGVSSDGWYDGLQAYDVHYSSGPVNRFFYFLSEGASSEPSSDAYSIWLPQGMTGIGNDRAARIWYKALTEHLTPAADFDSARDAAIAAAVELYGEGSIEEVAVMNAWAAVNVDPARIRVRMPVTNARGTFLDRNAGGVLSKVQLFPTRANVAIRANVTGTTNKGLSFALATPIEGMAAGNIGADGLWQTPGFSFHGDLLWVTAISLADPAEYAKGQALLVDLDTNMDGEADIFDLGLVAANWGAMTPYESVANVAGEFQVGDWSVVFFSEAMSNAWPVAQ